MRYSLASLALAALAVASPMPQGVTSAISPQGTTPAGCSSSYSGTFQIQVVNVTKSSSKAKRQQDDGALILTLEGGILKDSKDRTGYIAANRQFQFDGPPQTGAVYTAGWSVCSNGSLAIGPDAIFYQCLSGTFYNLYDEAEAAQCSEVYIQAIGSGSSSGAASQSADGQVTASPVSSAASEQSDGQVTASPVPTTAAPVSQITDGQVQASTGASAAPVSQISDGQIQATTAAPAPTTPVAPVTQITDGQIQAPTSTANPVTQISDGQIQAPTGANTTVASPTASVVPYTGGAMPIAIRSEFFALAAGVLAVALL